MPISAVHVCYICSEVESPLLHYTTDVLVTYRDWDVSVRRLTGSVYFSDCFVTLPKIYRARQEAGVKTTLNLTYQVLLELLKLSPHLNIAYV